MDDDDRLKRHDLTDAEWARLGPLLPAHPRQGHRWMDHRLVINGCSSGLGPGARGGICQSGFGHWKTVYNRYRRWSGDETWEQILDRLRAGCDEGAGRTWAVDAR